MLGELVLLQEMIMDGQHHVTSMHAQRVMDGQHHEVRMHEQRVMDGQHHLMHEQRVMDGQHHVMNMHAQRVMDGQHPQMSPAIHMDRMKEGHTAMAHLQNDIAMNGLMSKQHDAEMAVITHQHDAAMKLQQAMMLKFQGAKAMPPLLIHTAHPSIAFARPY